MARSCSISASNRRPITSRALDDPGPDPAYPLQMWLCASCGLAQLLVDPTVPEEPRGAEPAALVDQAADAVERVAAAGWLPAGARVAEYGSPHGGSWVALLVGRGLTPVGDGEQADVVLDCFGLMHSADQSTALAERAARVAPGGVLLLQYHSLATIVRLGQWNSLRHGHYAYYSTPALTRMLEAAGFVPRQAWRFELYGGTMLLAATQGTDEAPDASVDDLLAEELALGVEVPARVRALQDAAVSRAEALHRWLVDQKAARVHRARLRRRVACGCPAVPRGRRPQPASRRCRCIARQARSPHASDGHTGRRAGGTARRATGCGGRVPA